MFARILVPLDGSPQAEAILPEVVDLARLHGAQVLLLRVALVRALPGVDQTEAQVRAVDEAESYLADVGRRLAAQGIPVTGAVRYGHAVREILDHAASKRADLIALSTRGRSGIRRRVVGSTSERVVRAAPCAVVSIRAAA